MSMPQPIEPTQSQRDEIPAADPGAGGPDPADGFGVDGGEPDVMPVDEATLDDTADGKRPPKPPFRTPDPREIGPVKSA